MNCRALIYLPLRVAHMFVDFPEFAAPSRSCRFKGLLQMPGRSSTRTPTASRDSHKSLIQTPELRKSTVIPSLTVPEEGATSTLRTQICNVFSDAQKSAAGHRKLLVGLRKIQEACCYEPTRPSKPGRQVFNEENFKVEVTRCVIRLIAVKRSEAAADRITHFLGSFLRHAGEKGREN